MPKKQPKFLSAFLKSQKVWGNHSLRGGSFQRAGTTTKGTPRRSLQIVCFLVEHVGRQIPLKKGKPINSLSMVTFTGDNILNCIWKLVRSQCRRLVGFTGVLKYAKLIHATASWTIWGFRWSSRVTSHEVYFNSVTEVIRRVTTSWDSWSKNGHNWARWNWAKIIWL